MFRNPFEFRLRFIMSFIIGIIFGLLFLRLDYDQQAFQNISSVIFTLIVNIAFSNVQKNADVILYKKIHLIDFYFEIFFRVIIENYHYFSKNMMMEFIVQYHIMLLNLS